MAYRAEDYPVSLSFSEGDNEHVATTPAFPYVSALEPTVEALRGSWRDALSGVPEAIEEDGEEPPAPVPLPSGAPPLEL